MRCDKIALSNLFLFVVNIEKCAGIQIFFIFQILKKLGQGH